MENQTTGSKQVVLKWTLIYVVVAIVFTYTFQLLNIDQNSAAKYLGYIPFFAFMLLAQKEYKDQHGGYMTFGQGFSTGFKYALFSGIIMGVFIYIYLAFLSPQVLEQSLNAQQDKLSEQGMSSEQIDKAMQIGRSWGPLIGAVFLVIGSAILGALLSLIGAGIFKKERPPFDLESDPDTDPAV